MFGGGGGGKFYWIRNDESGIKVNGIVVLFVWVSIDERQLSNQVELYSSLGWNSLVCMADFLNPFVHEKATSLAFSLLGELVEDLRRRPCPLVFASFSGGSKACMHKVFQIIEGACEAELNPDDNLLVTSCISGQIYDSGPVDFTGELGARFALHPNIVKMLPGSAKVATFLAKSVTTSLDALFLTSFRSKQAEFWHTLYSSVGLGAPFLILCSENDDLAPYASIYKFAQRIQDLGGNVKLVKWRGSGHLGHYEHCPIQYRAAVSKLLEHALSIFSQKNTKNRRKKRHRRNARRNIRLNLRPPKCRRRFQSKSQKSRNRPKRSLLSAKFCRVSNQRIFFTRRRAAKRKTF
jgi:hypothetical protein